MTTTGNVAYNPVLRVFECRVCEEVVHVHRRTFHDPEAFVRLRELVEIDHAECSQYRDVRLAKAARRFRKNMKRHQRSLDRKRVYA